MLADIAEVIFPNGWVVGIDLSLYLSIAFAPGLVDGGLCNVRCVEKAEPCPKGQQRIACVRLGIGAVHPLNG